MKYYYNDQLIRTSKNHKYTHAVIKRVDGKIVCVGCSSSEDGARKIKQKEVSYYETRIANNEAAIKALKDGKSGYYYKDGRKTGYCKFEPERTIEFYEECKADNEATLNNLKKWEVVAIEEK